MFKRYPYTIGLLTVISFVVCVGCCSLTMPACIRSAMASPRSGRSWNAPWCSSHCSRRPANELRCIVWQQWVILGYALLEHFILIGTLRETKAKPGALVYQSLRLVILCALVLTI